MSAPTSVAPRPAPGPPNAPTKITDARSFQGFLSEAHHEGPAPAKRSGVEAIRLVTELVLEARKRPEILECTPDSIINFMYESAKLGLVIGHGCFPVPLKDHGVMKLNCWVGYKGLIELVI